MVRRNLIRITVLIGLALFVSQAFSQSSQPSDPQSKPRKIKQEPDRALIDWPRDVDPIITSSELEAWKKLDCTSNRPTTPACDLRPSWASGTIIIQCNRFISQD